MALRRSSATANFPLRPPESRCGRHRRDALGVARQLTDRRADGGGFRGGAGGVLAGPRHPEIFYTFRPEDDAVIVTITEYGARLFAGVLKDDIIANQFHPEKSQVGGELLIAAFLNRAP